MSAPITMSTDDGTSWNMGSSMSASWNMGSSISESVQDKEVMPYEDRDEVPLDTAAEDPRDTSTQHGRSGMTILTGSGLRRDGPRPPGTPIVASALGALPAARIQASIVQE